MTEPVGVDSAMERLADAIGSWQPAAPNAIATNRGTARGIFRRDIEQILAEIHRLRTTAGHG